MNHADHDAEALRLAPPFTETALRVLQAHCDGPVWTRAEGGYAGSIKTTWRPQVMMSPDVVVAAAGEADVVRAVQFAAAHDLPVAVLATGHGAVIPCGGVLINVSHLSGVDVMPTAARLRVGGGATWARALPLTQEHGLAPLVGSALGVGAVGYSLGGGVGWLCRAYGFAADRIVSARVVLANGDQARAAPDADAELLWALRGGGGNFGVVTELEIALVPVITVFGGNVHYPLSEAELVLRAFAGWAPTLPPTMTASITFMRYPDLPAIPAQVRGRPCVIVSACGTGDLDAAATVIEPMRHLATSLIDTFAVMPFRAVDRISSEPTQSVPVRDRTVMLNEINEDAMTALLTEIGDASESPLMLVDIRYIGGAGRMAPAGWGCANGHAAPYLMLATSPARDVAQRDAVDAALTRLDAALRPEATGSVAPNFLGASDPQLGTPAAAYGVSEYARLQRLKADYDPANRFRFNVNVPPAPLVE